MVKLAALRLPTMRWPRLSAGRGRLLMLLPWLVEALLVVLLAWALAALLLPQERLPAPQPNAQTIAAAVPVDRERLAATPLFGELPAELPPAMETAAPATLNLRLVGTIVAGNRSAAFLDMGGETRLIRIGETVQPGVSLRGVEVDAIVLDNGGRKERVALAKFGEAAAPAGMPPLPNLPMMSMPGVAPPGAPISPMPMAPESIGMPTSPFAGGAIPSVGAPFARPGNMAVPRNTVASETADMGKLLSQARVLPHFDAGKPDGFMIGEIVPASIYERIGLRNGDVIRKVNGQPVTTPQQAAAMYQALKSAPTISLELVRGGQVQQLNYVIR